jgi:FAD/FMN-containing dehydrogenase
MATSERIEGFPALSTTSEVAFSTKGQISRWSNTGVSPAGCAAIVAPSTEEDIVAVVKFSAQHGFKVLPTAGKHGAFLPINERSIYLDLKNFDNIKLDEEAGSVEIGGGVTTGRLCGVLAAKGWYTSRSNSSKPVRLLAITADSCRSP